MPVLRRDMMAAFRFKRAIPVSYDRQGFIFFTSKRYRELSAEERKRIRQLCAKAGGEHRDALLEFVTTDTTSALVCAKHYLSESTLERAVKRYYIAFAQIL